MSLSKIPPELSRQVNPYAYTIPSPPSLDASVLKKLDLWAALEFFRIEALLRSDAVQQYYRDGKTGLELYKRYRITWSVVSGHHHWLLSPDAMGRAGIVDLGEWGNVPPNNARQLLSLVRKPTSRFLHLQIDCAFPPITILKALKPILVERHRLIDASTPFKDKRWPPWPYHPRKSPPIRDVRAWLAYLSCYDLRKTESLTFGEIGKRVYDAPTGPSAREVKSRQVKYDEAQRGYKKVKNLVRAAVDGPWPPETL